MRTCVKFPSFPRSPPGSPSLRNPSPGPVPRPHVQAIPRGLSISQIYSPNNPALYSANHAHHTPTCHRCVAIAPTAGPDLRYIKCKHGSNEGTPKRSPTRGGVSTEFTGYLRKDIWKAPRKSFNPNVGALSFHTRRFSSEAHSHGARS